MKFTALAMLLLAMNSACSRDRTPAAQATSNPDSTSIIGQFSGPESFQYDAATDEYFVSNVNGDMAQKDDNGFISRLAPDGSIKKLKWVDGSTLPVTLHAPKGIAIHGDTLFTADIDTVREFSISTGSSLGAIGVPGARFLNDLTISTEGVLYATDSGLKEGMLPTTSDAIYRFDASGPVPIAKGTWLGRPNGIVVGPEGITVVTFGSKVVMRISAPGAKPDTLATLMQGSLDGLVRLSADSLLVSSWDGKEVYLVDLKNRKTRPIFANLEGPADIGYDTKRQRLLIPLVSQNRLEIRKFPP